MEKIICIPTKSDKLWISVRITGEMVKDFLIAQERHIPCRGKTAIHAAGEILLLEMLECVRWMKLEKQ